MCLPSMGIRSKQTGAEDKGDKAIDFLHPEPFAKPSLRALLADIKESPRTRMSGIVGMFLELNCKQVTEKSYAAAVAFMICCQGELENKAIAAACGSEGLELVVQMKELHALLGTGMVDACPVRVMPQTPEELKQIAPDLYNSVYAKEGPSDMRVDLCSTRD